jgi:hypothetical protein
MAQHDYIIANQSGAAFRADLNNGLAAIVSNNSGATQPSTTYAYQWWSDTTTGLLKLRNAANNAWITVGTLADANLGLLSLAGGTLTGALLADDSGTAALPAIAFDGDPNTGIFRPGADQFGIATNGVERVEFGTSEVVFNDGGADIDFRIEGDTKANLFKVDAGADTVIIDGLTHPSADGTADQSLVTNGSGVLSFASRSRIVAGTSVASTSGTAIDFTSIPSWVKRISVLLNDVSTNGTSSLIVQLGSGAGPTIKTTGYASYGVLSGSNSVLGQAFTTGFALFNGLTAVDGYGGIATFSTLGSSLWAASSNIGSTGGQGGFGGGYVNLSAVLTAIRITTAAGTDTFDSGNINIIYEG